MSMIEERLRDSLHGGDRQVHESPDLFERIVLSIEDDRKRRLRRRRVVAISAAVFGALVACLVAVIDRRKGELIMDWWVLELLTTGFLVALAMWLGPFIKRFGKGYAADVFRANPKTGKSFIVLTDFAYYLIFLAFILFTVTYEARSGWEQTVNAHQLQHETARIAGIVLIIGILHGVNLIALPIIGRLLTLNRRLDEDTSPPSQGETVRKDA